MVLFTQGFHGDPRYPEKRYANISNKPEKQSNQDNNNTQRGRLKTAAYKLRAIGEQVIRMQWIRLWKILEQSGIKWIFLFNFAEISVKV